MKRTIAAIGIVLLLPSFTYAALIKGGEEYTLREDDSVFGDLYVGAGTALVSGTVSGDLSIGGGSVLYLGNTSGDVLVGGGNLTLTGSVGDDLRAAGGTVTVSGPIRGDLVIAGGSVRIESSARIGGDVLIAGGRVLVDGPVAGNLRVYGGQVDIENSIGGSADISADKVNIGPRASIKGDLSYRAPQRAVIAEGATVGGHTIYKESRDFVEIGKNSLREALLAFLGLWLILKFMMTLLAALVITLLFGNLARELSARAVKEPWWSLLMGFALVVCVPIAAVFTFMTIVGAPLGVLALILYAFFLLLSVPMAGIVLGAWMLKLLKKTGAVEINWQRTVLGVLLYTALGFIPVIGWVLKLALILSSLGAFSHYWYRFVWLNR